MTITLEPATRLSGRVLDSEGLPVADAEISTSGECAPFTEQPVHSAQDGSYSLRCVAPGLQRVEIKHPQHSTIFTNVRLAPGDNSHDWTLRKRGEVQGRIVKPDGTLAERVYIYLPREPFAGALPADSVDGSFTAWIDAGRPVEIWASPGDGYALGKVALPAARPGDRIENVEIRLEEGTRLTGKIQGISPPGAEATIFVSPVILHHPLQYKSGQVDAEGRYEIPGLFPGTWTVQARSG
ncbi:MAG TPA: carboxypeptidase-like regulatory domain-containing protein, partial [Thermoanaerobaculia bacterium]|nr:carboxypeptidase-like regulatory domain-containing protein [Thermoanaerobaculia bacterium]